MPGRLQQESLLSYLLPILLAIVILAVSALINLVKIANLLEGAVLAAVVISGLFIGQYAAFKTLRIQERDALYGILSTIGFSGSHHLPVAGVLSQSEVLGLEASAREVWIYAYDLNYERFDHGRSPFTNAVISNLVKGVRYTYLIPNSPDIIRRAERMEEYLANYAKRAKQLQFRVAESPPLFNQFSVTLYNPDVVQPRRAQQAISAAEDANAESAVPVAVFFPHFKEFGSVGEERAVPFLAAREGNALEIQEKFEAMLRNATYLHPAREVK